MTVHEKQHTKYIMYTYKNTNIRVQMLCLYIYTSTLPDNMVLYHHHQHHEHYECQIDKEGKACSSGTCPHTREALNPEPIPSFFVDDHKPLHVRINQRGINKTKFFF